MPKFINPYTDFSFKKQHIEIQAVIDTALEEGREEGAYLQKVTIAKMMQLNGESVDKIMAYTGLSAAEIVKISA